jgi:lysophospholipase L1-like esterase
MHRGNLILLAASFVFCLLLGEVIIRLAGVAPEVAYIEKWRMRLAKNPKIGYEPIPNLDSTGKSLRYFGYPGKSNSLGFRDEEHSVKKRPGEKRVIVLGDSIVAGLWIEEDRHTLPVLLEEQLNTFDSTVEVMNFGVLGYNTQQEVETLIDKGLAFKPDLVVLNYCLNDRRQDDGGVYHHLLEEERSKRTLNTLTLTPLSRRSALFRWFRFVVLPALGIDSKPFQNRNPEIFGVDTVEPYLNKLAELSRQHEFGVLVTMFPDFRFVDRQIDVYEDGAEHRRIKEVVLHNGMPFLDLLPVFLACKEKNPTEYLASDRYHPKLPGNRCAAQGIAEYIEMNKLL